MKKLMVLSILALSTALTAFASTYTAFWTGNSQLITSYTGSAASGIRCEYRIHDSANTTFWTIFPNESFCPSTYDVHTD